MSLQVYPADEAFHKHAEPPRTSAPGPPADPEVPSLPMDDLPESLGAVQLCLPSAKSTLLASILTSYLTFVGLLCFGELGLPLPRPSWLTISFRFLGWLFVCILPVFAQPLPFVRDFLLWGTSPGHGKILPRWLPWLQRLAALLIFAALTFFPPLFGQPLGFFLVFAIGSILCTVSGALLSFMCGPPLLSFRYAVGVGPIIGALPIFGFGVLVSGYMGLRLVAGVWAGLLMPLLLSGYEFFGTMLAVRLFTKHFVTKQDVREVYAGTNQGLVISVSICCFHSMAEGARLTLLYLDNYSSQDYDFLLPMLVSVLWNVLTRLGCMDRFVSIITAGQIKAQNGTKLLRDAGYCMGYPRFGTAAALLLARTCLGNLLVFNEVEGWLWFCMLGAEVLEDVLGYLLWRAGVDFSPVKRFATEEEVQQMSERTVARRSSCERHSTQLSVVPSASRKSSDSAGAGPQESIKWEVRMAYDFKYAPASFGVLPFWAHLLPAAFAQFHTIVAMIVLSNGMTYILGFCRQDTENSMLWWPLRDERCSP